MMNRAKGATLAEIMKAPGWQAHTVRGCVSILGEQGRSKAVPGLRPRTAFEGKPGVSVMNFVRVARPRAC
jgi:hypothetical protein